MQTERIGTNEAGNRKAKRWGIRWYPDRASQSAQEQPGQPNRAGQDAQASQIEPVDAKLGQAGGAKSLGRSPRALEAAKPSLPAQRIVRGPPSWIQLGKSSWVTSLLT